MKCSNDRVTVHGCDYVSILTFLKSLPHNIIKTHTHGILLMHVRVKTWDKKVTHNSKKKDKNYCVIFIFYLYFFIF